MQCGDKIIHLIITNGSSVHVISQSAIKLLKLMLVPYSIPIKISRFDNTSLSIFERGEVHLKLGANSKIVWSCVFPMDVPHILLSGLGFILKNESNF